MYNAEAGAYHCLALMNRNGMSWGQNGVKQLEMVQISAKYTQSG
jgi:hypothetical protein